MTIKTYSQLSKLDNYTDRYSYLKENGRVGDETFGFERYLNQRFYKSRDWIHIRDLVILRDNGCDLGVEGHDIHGKIMIHHMNPLTIFDIRNCTKYLTDPEYLISTTLMTHNAIHYGDESLLITAPVKRCSNDMCPWKNKEV